MVDKTNFRDSDSETDALFDEAQTFLENVLGNVCVHRSRSDHGTESLTEEPRFFDRSGKPLDNLIGVSGTLFALRRNEDGTVRADVFLSANEARDRKAVLQINVTYSDAGNLTTQTQSIVDLQGNHPSANIFSTFNHESNELTVDSTVGTEQQTVGFRNGLPNKLELIRSAGDGDGQQLSFQFSVDGRMCAVTLNGVEIQGTAAEPFYDAAREVLTNVAENHGYTLPGTNNADGLELGDSVAASLSVQSDPLALPGKTIEPGQSDRLALPGRDYPADESPEMKFNPRFMYVSNNSLSSKPGDIVSDTPPMEFNVLPAAKPEHVPVPENNTKPLEKFQAPPQQKPVPPWFADSINFLPPQYQHHLTERPVLPPAPKPEDIVPALPRPNANANPQMREQVFDDLVHRFLHSPEQQNRQEILRQLQRHYYDHDDPSFLRAYQELHAFDAIVRLNTATAALGAGTGDVSQLTNQQFQAMCDLTRMAQGLGRGTNSIAEQGLQTFVNNGVPALRDSRIAAMNVAGTAARVTPRNLNELLNALADSGQTSGPDMDRALDALTALPPEQRARQLQEVQTVALGNFLRALQPQGNLTAERIRDGFTMISQIARQPSENAARAMATEIHAALENALRSTWLPSFFDQINNPAIQPPGQHEQVWQALRQQAQTVLRDRITGLIQQHAGEVAMQAMLRRPDLWRAANEAAHRENAQLTTRGRELISQFLQLPGATVQDRTPEQLRQMARDLQAIDAQLPANQNMVTPFGAQSREIRGAAALRELSMIEGERSYRVQQAVQALMSSQSAAARHFFGALPNGTIENLNTADLQRFAAGAYDHTINNLRIGEIVRPVFEQVSANPLTRPDLQQLRNIRQQLDAEVRRNNTTASEWREWADAQITLAELSATTDRDRAEELINSLVEQARPGENGRPGNHAFAALLSVVASGATADQQRAWHDNGNSFHGLGSMPLYPTRLAVSNAAELRQHATQQLCCLSPTHLNQSETMLLGLAMNNNDNESDRSIRASIESLLSDSSVSVSYSGALQALQADAVGLERVIARGFGTPEFERIRHGLGQWAREGHEPALRIMALAAASGQGAEFCQWAGAEIIRAAGAGHRDVAINSTMWALGENFQDRNCLLETLGTLSGMLEQPRADIRRALVEGYNRVHTAADLNLTPNDLARLRASASRALLTDPRNITPETIESIRRNISRPMAATLMETSGQLPVETARQFLTGLTTNLQEMQNRPQIDPTATLRAFQHLSRHATADQVRALAATAPLPEAVLDRAPHNYLNGRNEYQRTLTNTMLGIVIAGQDDAARRAALNYLEDTRLPAQLNDSTRAVLRNYVEAVASDSGTYNVSDIASICELVPGTNIHPPLPVLLFNLGVRPAGNDAVQNAALLQMGRDIQRQAGNDPQNLVNNFVAPLLAVRAWGDLPPSVRQRINPQGDITQTVEDITSIATRLAQHGSLPDDLNILYRLPQQIEQVRQETQQQLEQLNEQMRRLVQDRTHGPELQARLSQRANETFRELMRPHEAATREDPRHRGALATTLSEVHEQIRGIQPAAVEANYRYQAEAPGLLARIQETNAMLTALGRSDTTLHYQYHRAMGNSEQAFGELSTLWMQNALPQSLVGDLQANWTAMNRTGLSVETQLPRFTGTPAQRHQEVIGLLAGMRPFPVDNVDVRADVPLRTMHGIYNEAMQRRCIEELTADPAIQDFFRLQQEFNEITQALPACYHLLATAEDGERNQTLIAQVTLMANRLEAFMNSATTSGTIRRMQERFEEILRGVPASSPARAAIEQMRDSLIVAAGALGGTSDEGRAMRRQHNELRELVASINSGDINNSTTEQRILRVAITTATTMAAVALASAAVTVTCGAAAPVVAALVVPAAAMIAGHGSQELIHRANAWVGMPIVSRGSPVGELASGRMFYDPSLMQFRARTGSEVGSMLLHEYGTGVAMHGVTLGLAQGGSMAGAEFRGILFGGGSGVQAVAQRTFAREFAHNLLSASNLSTSMVQAGTEMAGVDGERLQALGLSMTLIEAFGRGGYQGRPPANKPANQILFGNDRHPGTGRPPSKPEFHPLNQQPEHGSPFKPQHHQRPANTMVVPGQLDRPPDPVGNPLHAANAKLNPAAKNLIPPAKERPSAKEVTPQVKEQVLPGEPSPPSKLQTPSSKNLVPAAKEQVPQQKDRPASKDQPYAKDQTPSAKARPASDKSHPPDKPPSNKGVEKPAAKTSSREKPVSTDPLSPEFHATHGREEVRQLVNRLAQGSNWTDLSVHEASLNRHFEARNRFNEAVSREARRTQQSVESVRQRAIEGQGPSELQQLHSEVQRSRTPQTAEIERRMQSMQELCNQIARERGIPEFRLNFDLVPPGVDGSYSNGQNRVNLPINELISPLGTARMRETLVHEMVHREQDVLMVRNMAQRLADSGVNLSTPEGMRTLTDQYHSANHYPLNERFARQVLDHYAGRRLSSGEIARADRLAEAIRTFTRDEMIRIDRFNVMFSNLEDAHNAAINARGRPQSDRIVENVLNEFSTPERRRFFLGEDNPQWLEPVRNAYRDGYITASEVIVRVHQELANSRNRQFEFSYRAALHELEAWHVSNTINPGGQPENVSGGGRARSGSAMTNPSRPLSSDVRDMLRRDNLLNERVTQGLGHLTDAQLEGLSANQLRRFAIAIEQGWVSGSTLEQIVARNGGADAARRLIELGMGGTPPGTQPTLNEHAVRRGLSDLASNPSAAAHYDIVRETNPQMLNHILSSPDVNLRRILLNASVHRMVFSVAQAEAVARLYGRSPQEARLVEQLFTAPRNRDVGYNSLVSELLTNRIPANELTTLSNRLDTLFPGEHRAQVPRLLESIVGLSRTNQSAAHTLVEHNVVTDRESFSLLLQTSNLPTLADAVSNQNLSAQQARQVLNLTGQHATDVMELVAHQNRQQSGRRLPQEHLNSAIQSAEQAAQRRQSLAQPHTASPLETQLERVRGNLSTHLDATTQEQLSQFQRNLSSTDLSASEVQARLHHLDLLAQAARTGTPNVEVVSQLAQNILSGTGGLTDVQARIDAFVTRPGGLQASRAVEAMLAHLRSRGGNAIQGPAGEPHLLAIPGWRVVTHEGSPLIENGRVVFENTGRVTVTEAQAAGFDMTLFRRTGSNSNGTVNLEFRSPVRLSIHPEDALVWTIANHSSGQSNCVNCTRALLTNLAAREGGLRAVAGGRIQTAEPQPTGNVTSFDYTGTGTDAGRTFTTLTAADLNALAPGIYRAETTTPIQIGGSRVEFHTFVVVAPAGGGTPYILDAALGQRYPVDRWGTVLRLQSVVRSGSSQPLTPSATAHR